MPHSQVLRAASILFGAIFALAIQSRAEEQSTPSKSVVKIELWMFELDVAKLRRLDLTSEQLDADGQSRSIKIIDAFEGKANDAPILQKPDQLLALLRSIGVARVLFEPALATTSGRKASFDIGRSKLTATPTVLESGHIRLDILAEYNEPMPAIGRRNPPSNKQWVVDTSMELEPGKTVLPLPLGKRNTIYPNGKPASPPRMPFVLVRATLENPTGQQPAPLAATSVVDREIPAASNAKSLTVHLKVVEVNRDKLKKLGMKWSQLTPESQKEVSIDSIDSLVHDGFPAHQLNGFLKSLQQNGLARVIAEPTLITLDGRPAEFTAGQTTIEFVPILLASDRVKLECRLKTGDAPHLLSAAELDLGQLSLLRNVKLDDVRHSRQLPGTETLVLASVDFLKSGEIPSIAGRPTYIEVAGRPK
jgi:hypothetical protein